MSNLRLLWKTELPRKFSLYLNIFYHSGFLNNLRLPWKQSVPWIHCIEYIFLSFRIFEQLALALKIEFALKTFTVFKYFLSFRIFEQLALALNTEFALKFFKPGDLPPPPRTPMSFNIKCKFASVSRRRAGPSKARSPIGSNRSNRLKAGPGRKSRGQ